MSNFRVIPVNSRMGIVGGNEILKDTAGLSLTSFQKQLRLLFMDSRASAGRHSMNFYFTSLVNVT